MKPFAKNFNAPKISLAGADAVDSQTNGSGCQFHDGNNLTVSLGRRPYAAGGGLAVLLLGTAVGFSKLGFSNDHIAVAEQRKIELDLTYIDLFERPRTRSLVVQSDESSSVGQPRALGLRRARAEFSWDMLGESAVTAVFRPDAIGVPRNQLEEKYGRLEFDSRATGKRGADAGEAGQFKSVYRPSSRIQLLDSYYLTAQFGPRFAISAGVFEKMAVTKRYYPDFLEFGLQVRFLEKFSAFRINWSRFELEPVSGAPVAPAGVYADFYIFQGQDDRVEQLKSTRRTFDFAPVAADPYYGGAINVGWVPSARIDLGFLGGFGDHSESDGRRSEVFLQFYSGSRIQVKSVGLHINFEVRYLKESWRKSTLNLAPLVQQSMGILTRTDLGHKVDYLLGFYLGRSDHHKVEDLTEKTPFSGNQVEFGVLGEFKKGLSLAMLINQERRVVDEGGSVQGAFFDESDRRKNMIRRMVIELRYAINDVGG